MAKISAIQAQLDKAAGRETKAETTPVPSESEPVAPRAVAARPKTREGRVHVGAWLPEAYSRNILLVRAKTGLPVKTIFAKALNELFREHGVPELDEE
jgi:hypothetical protein